MSGNILGTKAGYTINVITQKSSFVSKDFPSRRRKWKFLQLNLYVRLNSDNEKRILTQRKENVIGKYMYNVKCTVHACGIARRNYCRRISVSSSRESTCRRII